MSDFVWFSNWNFQAEFVLANLGAEWPAGSAVEHSNSQKRYRHGEVVDRSEIIQSLYFEIAKYPKNGIPSAIRCERFLVVSPELRDLLQQAELGASVFMPIPIYRKDRKTPFAEGHSIFCIRETKAAVDTSKSEGLLMSSGLVIGLTDDSVVFVNDTAYEGPEVWLDPNVRSHGVFFSARLGRALKDAGFGRRLQLKKTGIIN